MAKTRQHVEENNACDICESGLFIFDEGIRKPGEDESWQLSRTLSAQVFHEGCKECDAEANTTTGSSDLCTFCQHLRLRHLLRCIDPDEPPWKGTFVKFCRVEDIPQRVSFCPFCKLVVHAALPYRYFSGVASSNFGGVVVAISVGRELLMTRVEYPAGWVYGKNINFDHTLSGTKQPQKAKGRGSSESHWVGCIAPPQPKALVGSYVDWNLALRWLEDCHQNHKRCAPEKDGRFNLPVGFRLIDVNRRCIVETQGNCEFVALSYVWGSDPDPTKLFATSSNRESLKVDGTLSILDLPRTAEDAIQACRHLGEAYLWIDRFCISQDDDEDKTHQISAMATIYSLAKFALIITDGDSDSGIAGISRERAQAQMREQLYGFTFARQPAGWCEITGGGSVWSTRGWTYQEAVLPHRKLYLSDSRAFFQCNDNIRDECGSVLGFMSTLQLNNRPWDPLYRAFYRHLEKYRSRSLTNTDDVYKAIDGIGSALYGGHQSLLSGLPRQQFDEALLWCFQYGHYGPSARVPASNGSNPSWSWSSTDRRVALMDNTHQQIDYCGTIAAWTRVSQDGKSVESVKTIPGGKPLSHFQKNKDSCGCVYRSESIAERDLEGLLFSVLAWSQGCINRPCPFPQPHESTFTAMRSMLQARWSCHHQYWLEALQDVAPKKTNMSPPSTSIVFATVQSARFRLQGSVQRNGPLGPIFKDLCIAHPVGHPVGLLIAGDPGLGLDPESIAQNTFEFIALSISKSGSVVIPDGRVKNIREWDLDPSKPPPPVHVWSAPKGESGDNSESECWEESAEGDLEGKCEENSEQEGESDSKSEDKSEGETEEVNAKDKPQPGPKNDSRDDPESDESFKSAEKLQKLTFRDIEGNFLFPLPVMNVMMVKRTGEKSVRRISIGWIYLTSWINAGPKFETIFLE